MCIRDRLDAAAETAADARRHNDQGGLFGFAHDCLLLHSFLLVLIGRCVAGLSS